MLNIIPRNKWTSEEGRETVMKSLNKFIKLHSCEIVGLEHTTLPTTLP